MTHGSPEYRIQLVERRHHKSSRRRGGDASTVTRLCLIVAVCMCVWQVSVKDVRVGLVQLGLPASLVGTGRSKPTFKWLLPAHSPISPTHFYTHEGQAALTRPGNVCPLSSPILSLFPPPPPSNSSYHLPRPLASGEHGRPSVLSLPQSTTRGARRSGTTPASCGFTSLSDPHVVTFLPALDFEGAFDTSASGIPGVAADRWRHVAPHCHTQQHGPRAH